MTDFDWSAFEDALVDATVSAVLIATAQGPDERFAVVALDHLYRETDGLICLPHLAIGTAAEVAAGHTTDGWNPADGDRHHRLVAARRAHRLGATAERARLSR